MTALHVLPCFKATIPRQRGRGFGALAQVVGRTAIPLLTKYVGPIAKSIGKNLIEAAIPKVVSVVEGKKKVKQALKDTGKKTVKRQLGRGKKKTKKQRPTLSKSSRKISRKDFFSKLKE